VALEVAGVLEVVAVFVVVALVAGGF